MIEGILCAVSDSEMQEEALLSALKGRNTRRWQYDKIDCSWTGKDADLEPWGHQGLHLDGIENGKAKVTVHAGKTVAGDDVCLNLPDNSCDDECETARQKYLDIMTEVLCNCGFSGNWSGDDWFMTTEHTIQVPLVKSKEGIDAEASADKLIRAAQRSLKEWEREMRYVDRVGSELAGWTNSRGRRMREGSVPQCAAWKGAK